MAHLFRALPLFLLLAACAPQGDEPARPVVTRAGDLTIETRDLRSEATFAAVGLAGEGDRREGESSWDAIFGEGDARPERDGVRREFRITIANRSATAREFHARIDYVGSDGELIRRRTLERLVVAPFTETSWLGAVLLPHPGAGQAVARILPAAEPFDPSESR